MTWPANPLGQALASLDPGADLPRPGHPNGVFGMLIWQVVGYPAEEARQTRGMEALVAAVGLDPRAIAHASDETLRSVVRAGGSIAVDVRAERLRAAARCVVDDFAGDLDQLLSWPAARARKALTAFPMIGAPVADRILLFCGAAPTLAPESNGLRVLIRLGLVVAEGGYSRQYRAGNALAAEQLPHETGLLQRAHLILRHHGVSACKRSGPLRGDCPLGGQCGDRVGV